MHKKSKRLKESKMLIFQVRKLWKQLHADKCVSFSVEDSGTRMCTFFGKSCYSHLLFGTLKLGRTSKMHKKAIIQSMRKILSCRKSFLQNVSL